ncbi:hypothetical protein [Clostridium sp. HMP27]|uniref:hypothetical protein n=1 Tax=Clostridium sp. HMP27 TaxID=1487921 RepID=UPI00052D5C42|nr:hypothetical protein [Clostridium sp. HMP27]KGK90170.1 hypothetical protein DP68_01755 [Clostridium sp. HMP27]
MKKKVIFIVLVLMIVPLFLAIKFNTGAKTIGEAINPFGTNPITIIHEEKNNKGSIVFSYTSEGNGLYTAVLRKGIGGYRTVCSGVQGDIRLVSSKFDISHMYFPNVEKTALPIYFGVIGNPDISEVKIIEKKRNIEEKAKIINADGIKIWLVYMKKFQGSDFDIIGLSADGKQLIKIDGNISPYYAEQKPFKGYR